MNKQLWQEIESIKKAGEERHFKKPVTITRDNNKLEFTLTITEEDIKVIRSIIHNARINIEKRYEEFNSSEYNELKLAYIKRDDNWLGQFKAYINHCEEAIIDKYLELEEA